MPSKTQLIPGITSPMGNIDTTHYAHLSTFQQCTGDDDCVDPGSLHAGISSASSSQALHTSNSTATQSSTIVQPPFGKSVRPSNDDVHKDSHHHTDPIKNTLLEEEDRQNWLVMYRGIYLKDADAALGPVFVFFVACLFWARILPFAVALCVIPVMFLALVKIILIDGAGIQPKKLPWSRLPASMVVSVEVAAVLTFFISIMPMVQDLWVQCGLLVVFSLLSYYMHYQAIVSDPGYLPRGEHALPPTIPPEQVTAMQAANPFHCLRCGIYKPIRSSHCSTCNRCVADFDHHCPVVANCVGKKNTRVFSGYLVSLFLAECMWMSVSMEFFKRALRSGTANGVPSMWSVWWNCFSLGRVFPGTMFMTYLVVLIMGGTAFLMCRQLWCIAGNLTISEWILRDHKNYLKSQRDGTYYNPFDHGVVENCFQFWMNDNEHDWYSVYSDRKDLDPEKETRKWSVMNLMRAIGKGKKALVDARLKKKAEKEAWLLQNYGGAREHVDRLDGL